jgi:hypothetical protein
MPLFGGLATYNPLMYETEVHCLTQCGHDRRAPRASAPRFKPKVLGDRQRCRLLKGSQGATADGRDLRILKVRPKEHPFRNDYTT